MDEMNQFKEKVLNEYPRLGLQDSFHFSCHIGVPCFTQCCADVTIFLTPYDILRLKQRLGITSQEFLEQHTLSPFTKDQRLPVIVLRMGEDEHKRCPFVSENGCRVYEDRPWACRMYPLGLASPRESDGSDDSGEFYFLMRDPDCQGWDAGRQYTVAEWLDEQEVILYNRMGESFQKITLHDFFQKGNSLSPEQIEMFYLVCYNIDKFRVFVFESTFLKRFDVDAQIVERIRSDDMALLEFGMQWLRFCLFSEQTMTIREEVVQDVRRAAGMDRMK